VTVAVAPVELAVYPDDCDAFGHLNQASLLTLFERARWEALAAGPGADAFQKNGVWPALRKATVEYLRQVFPGERLRFDLVLTHHGHTSFALRQSAWKTGADELAATADFVFVCIGREGKPVAVPPEVSRFLGARSALRSGATQQVTVRGISMAVDVTGDGPSVLFVHGFPLDRTLWRPLVSTLTGWRRVAPDLRGMGLSDAPETDYTIAEYADDLVALLDALHIERAIVCGLSMGGYVAFDLVRRYPDRVQGLVLVNTRASADDADGRARRDAMIARVRRDGTGFLADDMVPKLLAATSIETMPDVVRQVSAMATGSPPGGIVGALAAMRDRPDSRDLLPRIALPTLVIAGSNDQMIPTAEGRAMATAIPHAHFAVIPSAGHLAPLEQPVNTSRVIREFLESLL
jgi:pimeloyl-ACP methyl ester carboxylesterase/acyl-CoA thioesterase FadM